MGLMRGLWVRALWAGVLISISELTWAEPTAIRVTQIEFGQYGKTVTGSGVIRPISEQSLGFKVPGVIQKVLVKQGEQVKKGQLLAQLELEEVQAQVAKAQAVLDDAKRQLDRLTQLENKQLASNEQIRQASTAMDVAKSNLTIARFNLKYAQIHAPADGRILNRFVESNEIIGAGQRAFIFADDTQGWSVKLAVADVDVVKLEIGDEARLQLDAYPNNTIKAKVREISGRAHERTQTFEVDLYIDTQLKLYSGLIAHTEITPNSQMQLAKVPLTALIQAIGQDAQIYIINQQGHAQLVPVTVAYVDGRFAYIKNGINNGAHVVIEGGPFIQNGDDIAIVKF